MEALGVKSKKANLGNIVRILAIPVSDVIRIRRAVSLNQHILPIRPVRVKEGKKFYNLLTISIFCNFSEQKNTGESGDLFSQVIEMFLPDDSKEIRYVLEILHEEKFILAFKDSNGVSRLMGSKDNPATLSEDFTTSQNRGRKFMFKCTSTERAYFINSIDSDFLYGNETDYVGVVVIDDGGFVPPPFPPLPEETIP